VAAFTSSERTMEVTATPGTLPLNTCAASRGPIAIRFPCPRGAGRKPSSTRGSPSSARSSSRNGAARQSAAIRSSTRPTMAGE